jgi:hypothetical protein
MRLKKNALIGIILLVALSVFSCIDEPILEPPSRPFATIRVGNLTSNVNSMSVFIDGQQPVSQLNALLNREATPFFDVTAGKRLFTILLSDSTSTDTIYNKQIEISSYTELSIFFVGDYSSVDTLNNFKDFLYQEGLTYYDDSPVSNRAHITFINMVTVGLDPLTDVPSIDVFDDTNGKDSITVEQLEGFETKGFNDAAIGDRKFEFKKYYTNTVIGSDSINIAAGRRYLVFLSGNAISPAVSHFSNDPLPVRGK